MKMYREKITATASQIRQHFGKQDFSNYTMVVLGSGFKGFAEALSSSASIKLDQLEHVPVPKVSGHGGDLILVDAPVPALVFSGRVHLYEGYSADDVCFSLRVCHALGVRKVFLTNASGSVNADIKGGTVVCVEDHINLTGLSSISGPEPYAGERFVDMVGAYHPEWVEKISSTLKLRRAVYLGVTGPAYETPAETRAFRHIGADIVGMSTVQETIAARQLGMRVACLSLVTNQAGGLADSVDHQDVLKIGRENRDLLARTLLNAIELIQD